MTQKAFSGNFQGPDDPGDITLARLGVSGCRGNGHCSAEGTESRGRSDQLHRSVASRESRNRITSEFLALSRGISDTHTDTFLRHSWMSPVYLR